MGKNLNTHTKQYNQKHQAVSMLSVQDISSNSFYDLFKKTSRETLTVNYKQSNDWERLARTDSKTIDNASLVEMHNLHESELKRISREMHDGLGQLLTNINLRIQHCVTDIKNSGGEDVLGDSLESLESRPALVTEVMGEVRNICSALRPAILDDLGVLAAITWQCRQCREAVSGLETELDFSLKESDIPEEFKTALYRIVQEALNNVVKYSGAKKIILNLKRTPGAITLSISDNGKGFDIEDKNISPQDFDLCGNGLRNMRERAEILGGTFALESQKNLGTRIQVSFPVSQLD